MTLNFQGVSFESLLGLFWVSFGSLLGLFWEKETQKRLKRDFFENHCSESDVLVA